MRHLSLIIMVTLTIDFISVSAFADPPIVPNAPSERLSQDQVDRLQKVCQEKYLPALGKKSMQMQDMGSPEYIISRYVDPICKLLVFGKYENLRPWKIDPSTEEWVNNNTQYLKN